MKKIAHLFLLTLMVSILITQSYEVTRVDGETYTSLLSSADSTKYMVLVSDQVPKHYLRSYSLGNPSLPEEGFKSTQFETAASDCEIKAHSPKLDCALVFCPTSPEKLPIVDFTSDPPFEIVDLIGKFGILAENVGGMEFQLADSCKAIEFGGETYHYDLTETDKYAQDLNKPTGWGTPIFSADYTWAFGSDGIYHYDTVSKSYVNKVSLTNSATNSRLFSSNTNSRLILYYGTDTGTGNIQDYVIKFYSFDGTDLTEITGTEIIGKSYKDTLPLNPDFSHSTDLSVFLVYGKDETQALFLTAKKIDWVSATKTVSEITDVASLILTEKIYSVSSQFIYWRDSTHHGGYYLKENSPFKYFETLLSEEEKSTDWKRTFLIADETNNPQSIYLYRESQPPTTGNLLTVIDETHLVSKESVKFKITEKGTIDSGSEREGENNIAYISSLTNLASDGKVFVSFGLDSSLTGQNLIFKETGIDFEMKASSENKQCALVYDATGEVLKMLYFTDQSLVEAQEITISSPVYTVSEMATASFHIADDCLSFRINDKIFHNLQTDGTAIQDNLPTDVTALTNPAFTTDFSMVVVDDGVYSYTPEVHPTPGTYSILISDDFTGNKKVWKSDNNFIIFTSAETTTSGIWDFTLRSYKIVGTEIKTIGNFPGKTSGEPSIVVSPKLTKAIVYGKQEAYSSAPFYLAKTINYETETSKDIVLTSVITDNENELVIADEILYVRNKGLPTNKHYGYQIMGMTLIEFFNEDIPELLTIDYKKTAIELKSNKFIFYSQLRTSDDFFYVIKNERVAPASITSIFSCGDACIKCSPLCATCSTVSPAVCETAIVGYYLDTNSEPQKCHSDCVECNDAGIDKCTVCKTGTYLDPTGTGTGTCKPCISDCLSCTDGTTCSTCRLGYVFNQADNKCIKCLSGCTTCNEANVFECSQCNDGYEAVLVDGVISECKKCPENCKTCASGVCSVCQTGFREVNGECYPACTEPCKECTEDPSKCTSCLDGYELQTETCAPDTSCNGTNSCTVCPYGQVLLGGNCFDCDDKTNCKTCLKNDFEKCSECQKGFYLNSFYQCTACNSEGCSACVSDSVCSECEAGYVLSAGEGSFSTCIKCDLNCATCSGTPDNCETCAAGYTLKGWNCISNFNVIFELALPAEVSTTTTEHYLLIENEIKTLLSLPSSKISFESLSLNPNILKGFVDATSSTEEVTIFDSLFQNEAQISIVINSQTVKIPITELTATGSQIGTFRSDIGSTESPNLVYKNFIGTDNTKFNVLKKSENGFKYFIKSPVEPSSTQFVFRRYEFMDSYKMNEYQVESTDCITKAVSNNMDCAIIYCPTVGSETLEVVKFEVGNAAEKVSDLIQATTLASTDHSKSFQVSDLCTAFSVDTDSYHYDQATSTYVKDLNTPTWTNPIFSNDFKWVVANEGIYIYDTANQKYTQSKAETFSINKKIWTTNSALLVLSWTDNTTPGIQDYELKLYSISGTTPSEITQMTGQSYKTVDPKGPEISVSSSLDVIVLYGKEDASTLFFKGKKVNYETTPTSSDLTFPATLTETQSYFTVSSRYIYLLNTQEKTGTTDKYHSAFYIDGSNLVPYFNTILTTEEKADWSRSFLFDANTDPKSIFLYRETLPANGSIIITEQTHQLENQVLKLKLNEKGTINSIIESSSEVTFFSEQTTPSGGKAFLSFVWDWMTIDQKANFIETSTSHVLKAVSANKKCALVYETDNSNLKMYDYNTITSSNPKVIIIDSSLYSSANIGTDKFDIDNTCSHFRINDDIYSGLKDDGTAVKDTLPVDVTTLTNPIFSSDFSMIVTDDKILTYTAGTAPAAGSYSIDRSDLTLDPIRSVWKDANNFIIFTKKETATAGIWSFNVQFNKLVESAVSKSVGDFTGETKGEPSIVVSPKLMKIIITGKKSDNELQPFYFAKTIDYDTEKVLNIILTDTIEQEFNEITMTDEILYVRNTATTPNKHFGYYMMGQTLIESFNEEVSPLILTTEYVKTVIQNTNDKIFVYSEMRSNDWLYVVKSEKTFTKTLSSEISIISHMDFEFFSEYESTLWGKWLKKENSQANNIGEFDNTFTYIEYDPTDTLTYKKTISKTISAVSNDYQLFGASSTMDCVLLYSELDTTLKILEIDSVGTAINEIADVHTTLSSFYTAAEIKSAVDNKLVRSGPSCWAFSFKNILFVKDSGASTYQRSTVAVDSAWTTYTFDSSLNYVLAAGKVYKYGIADYEELFVVTGIKSSRELLVNKDGDKIIVFSYQPDTLDLETPYTGNIKLFFKKADDSWSKIANDFTVSTIIDQPIMVCSPDFSVIGLQYNNGSDTEKKSIAKFIKVDLTLETPAFTEFITPSTFSMNYDLTKQMKLSLFNTYLSVINPETKTDYVFTIDSANLKFSEFSRRDLSDLDLTNTERVDIQEVSSKVTEMYELVENNKLYLIKRELGSATISQAISLLPKREFGYFVEDNILIPCPAGCTSCLSLSACTACLPGFILNNQFVCVRCDSECSACSSIDPLICNTPIDGYFIDIGVPEKCHEDCIKCSAVGADKCTSCKIGTYLDLKPSGTCKPCLSDCLSCNDGTSCNSCRLGFVYNPTLEKCVKCLSGCTSCKYDKVYECSQCNSGYEPTLSGSVITGCKKCPPKCLKCVEGTCSECELGLRLLNNKCIKQCEAPCEECSEDPKACISCLNGYTLNGETCDPDLSCNIGKTCSNCPLGFNLVGGECLLCDAGPNCKACSKSDIQSCIICEKGSYLDNTFKCITCTLDGCLDCVTNSVCSECQEGYVLSSVTGSLSTCVKCNPNCATCSGTPDNCETCATGYTLKGWSCVKNFNVAFNFKLDGEFLEMTTEQYLSIEDSMSSLFGVTREEINIDSLKPGSIIVIGSVNVASSDSELTMLETLRTALSSGASIGGLPVTTFEFTSVSTGELYVSSDPSGEPDVVYITDESEEERYRDIAIIVGTVIPVGLITIFLVLLLLYKKGYIFSKEAKISSMSEENLDNKESSGMKLKEIVHEKNFVAIENLTDIKN